MSSFQRFIGIDYSGAETPESSLKGIRAYEAKPGREPREVLPPPSSRKYWTRQGLAEWLITELRDGPPSLVGIDHAFSFPLRYFNEHGLELNWDCFLSDFRLHWPTDREHCYVDFVREGEVGNGAERRGNSKWRRLAEQQGTGAKSVFHFDVPGSVAKSTHAGLPWLLKMREALGPSVFWWPFDGWMPPVTKSVVLEVYPALWTRDYPQEGRDGHQQDAYSVARWMAESAVNGTLESYFKPALNSIQRQTAEVEGWIFGMDGSTESGSRRQTKRSPTSHSSSRALGAGMNLIVRAVAFAAEKHRIHRRKDEGESAYFVHLAEVASILSCEAGIDDPEVIAAAYLHDTVEDTETTREELEAEFGPRVAGLVMSVTDDKSLPKQRRKELQIQHAAHASADKALIKMADKIANLRSILATPPAGWGEERIAAYFEWAGKVVDALPEKHPALLLAFESVQREFRGRENQ